MHKIVVHIGLSPAMLVKRQPKHTKHGKILTLSQFQGTKKGNAKKQYEKCQLYIKGLEQQYYPYFL